MKEKNDIKPPSKKTETLPATPDQLLNDLYARKAAIGNERDAVEKEIKGIEKFSETVPKAAKAFGVNRGDLRDAFNNDKGQMVSLFEKRQAAKSKSIESGLTGVLCTSGGVLVTSMSVSIGSVVLGAEGVLVGAMGALLLLASKLYHNDKKQIDVDVKKTVEQHKLLPGPAMKP